MATKTIPIEDTVEELKARLDRLQNDMYKRADSFAERARSAGSAALDAGIEQTRGLIATGRRAWGSAGDNVASLARGAASDVAAFAEDGSSRTIVGARRLVRSRPMISVGLALLAGLVIGKALYRE